MSGGNLSDVVRMLGRDVPPIETAIVRGVRVTRGGVLLDVTVEPLGFETTLRLMMPYLGGGLGAVVLPRIGDEVVALFPGRSRQSGYALWSCYNGVDTVPDGVAEDLILIEGRSGDSLKVHLRGGATVEIDRSLGTTVHQDEARQVDGSRATQIGKDDSEQIGGNRMLQVAGNESRQIAGAKQEAVTGPVTEATSAARTTNVGAAWNINVTGAMTLNVGGVYTLSVNGIPVMVTDGSEVTFAPHVTFAGGTSGDRT